MQDGDTLFSILMWVLGVLQAVILGIHTVMWLKISSLEKEDRYVGERLTKIETKLSNGIQNSLQRLEKKQEALEDLIQMVLRQLDVNTAVARMLPPQKPEKGSEL